MAAHGAAPGGSITGAGLAAGDEFSVTDQDGGTGSTPIRKNLTLTEMLARVFTGTATNDDAAAGKIGEYITSNVVSGSAVSLTSGAAKTITSITLSAGDWQLSGGLIFVPAGAPTWLSAEWSLTDNVQDQAAPHGGRTSLQLSFTNARNQILQLGTERLSLAAEDVVYLVAYAEFSSTMTSYGYLSARRMR